MCVCLCVSVTFCLSSARDIYSFRTNTHALTRSNLYVTGLQPIRFSQHLLHVAREGTERDMRPRRPAKAGMVAGVRRANRQFTGYE